LHESAELVAKYSALARPDNPHHNPIYAAMLERADTAVGRLLAKLAALKLADNTLVLITSDNGGLATKEGPHTPATSNAPLRAGKGYNYEGGLRVPLLVRWPGQVSPGTTCDKPVCSIDYYPTILEAAGVAHPEGHIVDGVSLVSLLQQTGTIARTLYWHYPHYSNQGGNPGGATRQGDWKLIEHYETGKVELYNLESDVAEAHDLATKHPAKAQQLQEQLGNWRRDVSANLPVANPDYRAPE